MRCESKGIQAERTDRGCGFLTKTEREFLLGEWSPGGSPPSEQQKQQKASDIKIRTRHALADFALLEEHATQELLESVIQQNSQPPVFSDGLVTTMADGMMFFALRAMFGKEFGDMLRELFESEEFEEFVIEEFEGGGELYSTVGPDSDTV
jgi:hypothetical protein